MPHTPNEKSLQRRFAPQSICFGCGPANPKGLHIESFVGGDEVIAAWKPEEHHQAFAGILNGGIVGTLLDCHANWAGAWYLMEKNQLKKPPCTVTAEYSIKLLRPAPIDQILTLRARAVDSVDDRVVVKATLEVDGKVCAICRGLFVAVKPDHPAYHRW